jgi:sulfatase modifying factor 1
MIKSFSILLAMMLSCCGQAKDFGSSSDSSHGNDSETEMDTADTLSPVDSETSKDSADSEESEIHLSTDEIEADWGVIPNGEFTYGSPYSQPCRGAIDEEPVDVIITHPFKMAATEVTRKQWHMTGIQDPSKAEPCDDCAQGWVNWYDTLAWLNSLSKAAGLPECYDLSSCVGEVGARCPDGDFYQYGCRLEQGTTEFLPQIFTCPGNVHKYQARWDCPGYRLPTVAEWEWAARGGTTTATYNGELTTDSADCPLDPVLDPIAWHCGNSDKALHPVAELLPNDYSLYDMIGNAGEWTSDVYTGAGLQESEGIDPPLVDPVGKLDEHWARTRPLRGGFTGMYACRCAATTNFPEQGEARTYYSGFRPVRTILD